MKKSILSTLILLSAVFMARAQTPAPTWASDMQCIVYTHCTGCHNPGGIAPFALTTYEDAFLNMYSVKSAVTALLMPPYLPNTNYQHYTDMRNLTTQEINTIVAWVDSGGQEGDTTNLMAPPVYSNGALLTHPDLTARIPTFTVPSTGSDVFQCFVITGPQATTNYIKTIEIVPGNLAAVHHVLVFVDTAYKVVSEDSAYAGPGYPDFGGTGSTTSKLIGVWVPGAGIDSMPSGMGIGFGAGSRIILQVHYPVTSAGLTDSTRINLQYTTTTPIRNVTVDQVLNYYTNMTDGPIDIPADSTRTYHEQYTIPAKVTLLGVMPHAHLVCQQMETYAVTPTGDTIPLIDIPNWDFHWQGSHFFQKPIVLPAGSTLYGWGYYNNTYNNPNGPRPITTVVAGEETSNEMLLFFYWYLPYKTGDENIIIDTSAYAPNYLGCVSAYAGDTSTATGIIQTSANGKCAIYPNPAQNILNYMSATTISEITIIDIQGETVSVTEPTDKQGQIPVSGLSSGFYLVRMQKADGTIDTLRFVKD